MECISELKDSLNVYFGWNKARMACFVNMLLALLALLATRTVNLNKLACVVFGDALQTSRYRRIQRFFSKFPLDYRQIAGFIFKLFLIIFTIRFTQTANPAILPISFHFTIAHL